MDCCERVFFMCLIFVSSLSYSEGDIADLVFGDRSIPPAHRLFPLLHDNAPLLPELPDYPEPVNGFRDETYPTPSRTNEDTSYQRPQPPSRQNYDVDPPNQNDYDNVPLHRRHLPRPRHFSKGPIHRNDYGEGSNNFDQNPAYNVDHKETPSQSNSLWDRFRNMGKGNSTADAGITSSKSFDKSKSNDSEKQHKDKDKDRNVLKPITKRKFFFQVKPVVPFNDTVVENETIYYVRK